MPKKNEKKNEKRNEINEKTETPWTPLKKNREKIKELRIPFDIESWTIVLSEFRIWVNIDGVRIRPRGKPNPDPTKKKKPGSDLLIYSYYMNLLKMFV